MSLLGVDVGTSGCKAAVFSINGRCLSSAYREYTPERPRPGRAQLDSQLVWDKVKQVISQVAVAAGKDKPVAMSVSSIGEAFIPVSADREILGPAILSFDTRGSQYSQALVREFGLKNFYRINCNLPGPHLSLPKLLWIREHQPQLYRKADYFLLWADLVNFLLGAEPVTTNSLASRTLLFDFSRQDWSEPLLSWSGLDREKLARIVPAGKVVGKIAPSLTEELNLPGGLLLVSGGHDQCLNALGCGAIAPGKLVCGLGTYECLAPVYSPLADPLKLLPEKLNMENHVVPGLVVSFLYHQAGLLVRWFRDTFASSESASADIYRRLNQEIPEQPTGLFVLPHFEPPQWPVYVKETAGVILGLKTTTSRGEILKAIMEGTSFYFLKGMASLKRLGIPVKECLASGGGASSDAWLQIHADIFGFPFTRPRVTEAGLAGCAMLAGLACGLYGSFSEAAALFIQEEKTFYPDARRHRIYQEKYEIFQKIYSAVKPLLTAMAEPKIRKSQ